jgi:hypothetical protein
MAAPPLAASVVVQGNVEGSIVYGDNNFVVNTNNGTIIYKQATPRVSARTVTPKPPRKPKSFIGRAKELAQLENWIAGNAPVLLSGQPGLGKTTLAKQAANGPAVLSMPNGVVFIESPDVDGKILGFDDVVQLMFDALFDSDPPLKVDVASARTYLSNVRPLVYLNGVSLTSADLDNLSSLFPSTPVLIETEAPVSDDDYEDMPLGPFKRDDSLALLADRSGLPVDSTSQPIFDSIASILNDVPGALAIIGSALKENRLKLEEVPAGLNAINPGTKTPAGTAMARAYRLVISTLSADERAMLIETASVPGISVDRKWLERVSHGEDVSRKLESLQLLYANSPRLRMNSGLREVVMENQDDAPAREQLLQYFVEQLRNRWSDFDFIRDELGNLLGLFDWAMSQQRWKEVIALGRALDPFLTLNGLWGAWHHLVVEVYQAAAVLGDDAVEGWALHQMGTSEIGFGDLDSARRNLERALQLRKAIGDSAGAAYTQHNLDLLGSGAAPEIQIKRSGSAGRSWFIGGGFVLIVLMALIAAANVFGLPSFPRQHTATPSVALTSSFTPTLSSTPTFAPSVTATVPPSETPSPTVTPTFTPSATPTYAILTGTVLESSACFYGPGAMYLYKYGLKAGSNLDVVGINVNTKGTWLYVQNMFARLPNPCWINAQNMKVAGDPALLEPAYPDKSPLPKSPNYPPPAGVFAGRDGDQVTISWDFTTPIPPGMRESTDSPYWLVELWTCQKGRIVFTPIGAFDSTIVITDETGCSQPSHGRIYLSDVDGYDGPSEIPWPTP